MEVPVIEGESALDGLFRQVGSLILYRDMGKPRLASTQFHPGQPSNWDAGTCHCKKWAYPMKRMRPFDR